MVCDKISGAATFFATDVFPCVPSSYLFPTARKNCMIRNVDIGKNFGVLIYSEEQLLDIKRFCCTGKTPLGFDRTFNLGELFVTASAFKQLSVTNPSNGQHPIILGPLFLHGFSTFESYHQFFSSLAASLRDTDTSKLIIGSDDEAALREAIKFNFPKAKNILCTRHLRNNFEEYLKNKIGLTQRERQKFLNDKLFGTEHGLLSTEDSTIFDILL